MSTVKKLFSEYGLTTWRLIVIIFLAGIAFGDRQNYAKRLERLEIQVETGNVQKAKIQERLVRIETILGGIDKELKTWNGGGP